MDNQERYFQEIKDLCISECKSHSFDEIAQDMFSKKEIIDTFLQQETQDPTFWFIIALLQNMGVKNENIYIPWAGTGWLWRQIIKHFPETHILQVDNNPDMIKISQSHSPGSNHLKTLKGDILTTDFGNQKFTIIIAQGVLRYIDEDKRNDLLGQREHLIEKNWKIIVCEGIAKEVIDKLQYDKLESTGIISQKAELFRFSLFYLLYKEYQNNTTFYETVKKVQKETHKNYVQILREIAGKNDNKIYVKIFSKK